MPQDNTTPLPEEIISQIEQEAENYAEGEQSCWTNDYAGYYAGATEWAHWKLRADEMFFRFKYILACLGQDLDRQEIMEWMIKQIEQYKTTTP